ncbi:MAG: hypothetical protein NT043_00805 [Candidatus Bathyarchaeota archaeon]|nr:hypothetical protein [Candidatus Bathyarchaeota archaeon]
MKKKKPYWQLCKSTEKKEINKPHSEKHYLSSPERKQMTPEQIALLNIRITTIITILGWGITALIQIIILRKSTKSQQLERELAVFRERLKTIKRINSSLIASATPYLKLATLFFSDHFTFEQGNEIVQEMKDSSTLSEILYDPEFQMLQNLLSKERADILDSQLVKIGSLGSTFFNASSQLSPLNLNPAILQKLGQDAINIVRELTNTAKMFSEEYSILDKNLASGKKSK